MPYNGAAANQIGYLRPSDIRSYALSKGWESVRLGDDEDSNIAVLRRDFNEIIVPQRRELSDFARRMAEALDTLSEVEGRPYTEVLNDVTFYTSDVLRFAQSSSYTADGTIPMDEGVELFTSIQRAAQAKAMDIAKPRLYHSRLATVETKEILSNWRFGQTEHSSFVASVICPLGDGQQTLFPEMQLDSRSRVITSSLMRSVQHISDVMAEGRPDRLLAPDIEHGDPLISGNFMDALADMEPEASGAKLEIRAAWARYSPVTTIIPQKSSLVKPYFRILREIASDLRPSKDPEYDQFVGKIEALSGQFGSLGLPSGDVVLRTTFEKRLVSAHIQLSEEHYAVACDAHKLGQFISVHGMMKKSHNRFHLEDYSDFMIVK